MVHACQAAAVGIHAGNIGRPSTFAGRQAMEAAPSPSCADAYDSLPSKMQGEPCLRNSAERRTSRFQSQKRRANRIASHQHLARRLQDGRARGHISRIWRTRLGCPGESLVPSQLIRDDRLGYPALYLCLAEHLRFAFGERVDPRADGRAQARHGLPSRTRTSLWCFCPGSLSFGWSARKSLVSHFFLQRCSFGWLTLRQFGDGGSTIFATQSVGKRLLIEKYGYVQK
jgi:hypothetical protein